VNYLEIGIEDGNTFSNINAARKVGVDPFPRVNTLNLPPNISIHSEYSDTFFQRNEENFDFAFIDGLHTWDQTYRDIINAFNHGTSNMAILVDDVVPCDASAGMRNQIDCQVEKKRLGIDNNFWMGDVYKCVKLLSMFHPEITLYTITEANENPQLLLMRQSKNSVIKTLSIEQIQSITNNVSFTSEFYGGSIPTYFNKVTFVQAHTALRWHINSN
jgi:hypothetical protein